MNLYNREIVVSYDDIRVEKRTMEMLKQNLKEYKEGVYDSSRDVSMNKLETHVLNAYLKAIHQDVNSVEARLDKQIIEGRYLGDSCVKMTREYFVYIGELYDGFLHVLFQFIAGFIEYNEFYDEWEEEEHMTGDVIVSESLGFHFEVEKVEDEYVVVNSPTSNSQIQFMSQVDYVSGYGVAVNDDIHVYNRFSKRVDEVRLVPLRGSEVCVLLELILRYMDKRSRNSSRLISKFCYKEYCTWIRNLKRSHGHLKQDIFGNVDFISSEYTVIPSRLSQERRNRMYQWEKLICIHNRYHCLPCAFKVSNKKFIKYMKEEMVKEVSEIVGNFIHYHTADVEDNFVEVCGQLWNNNYYELRDSSSYLVAILKIYASYNIEGAYADCRSVDYVCAAWLTGRRNSYLSEFNPTRRTVRHVISTKLK